MQISIRELKANPSAAIAKTQRGERVQITSHRKVVAELVRPLSLTTASAQTANDIVHELSDDEALKKLMASGFAAQAATQPLQLGKAVKFPPGPAGQTMSDLVVALRAPK